MSEETLTKAQLLAWCERVAAVPQAHRRGRSVEQAVISHVAFAQPIWVLGTARHEDQFRAEDGWVIELTPTTGVISLRRPAQQNVPEVPAFEVWGIGYCTRWEDVAASGSPEEEAPNNAAALSEVAGSIPAPTTEVRKRKR